MQETLPQKKNVWTVVLCIHIHVAEIVSEIGVLLI